MSFAMNHSCCYSAIIFCNNSAIILCEFPIQTVKSAIMQLIEKSEEIKKKIRTWSWGRHVFKLYHFEEGGHNFYFL